MKTLNQKFENLKNLLKQLGNVAVAFSGGVDSTFLLKAAQEVLNEKVTAITVDSCFIPEREKIEAKKFCQDNGIKHILLPYEPLKNAELINNPPQRCYICKKSIFIKIKELANKQDIPYVIEGSNLDDLGDYRPGLKAIDELEILSPLRKAELNKNEIRELSHQLNLYVWNKSSFACLASRFVYGEEISIEKLKMVERAENYLQDMGFTQFRVRIHNLMSRIEILPTDFEKLLQVREKIFMEFRKYGFAYVTMDLQGYRTGSMNENLDIKKEHNIG